MIYFSFILGALSFLIIKKLKTKIYLREVAKEAKLLTEKSEEILDEKKSLIQKEVSSFKEKKLLEIDQLKSEKDLALKKTENKLLKEEEKFLEEASFLEDKLNELKKSVQSKEDKLRHKKKLQLKFKEEKLEQEKKYTSRILDQVKLDKKSFIEKNVAEVLDETKSKLQRQVQWIEESSLLDAEKNAKRILHTILNRFEASNCMERGIGIVFVRNEKTLENLLKNERSLLKVIESECGVDIRHNQTSNGFSFSGFDPVRQALAFRVLSKVCEKEIFETHKIKKMIRENKKSLFDQIKKDGIRICKELNLRAHNEIKQALGSLRYRYSFTQNQYFHVKEVSYLCGLLSSELGLNLIDGKKAGLFHDIGKSMDHIVPGTHAVIGADFIEKYGEKDSVVYAVKAHHHDVSPSHVLDYLVIAADALSGARPGARRFTAVNYEQKMQQLESIGKSFEAVEEAYVINGGKELRVMVNPEKISDKQSLKLGQEISKKIETECVYSGTVKISLIRKTILVEKTGQ